MASAASAEWSLVDTDYIVFVPVILLAAVLHFSLPTVRTLSLRDKLVAFWYLFNGVIIHVFLDG